MQLMAINSWRDVIVVVEGAIIFAMTQHVSDVSIPVKKPEQNKNNN
jgi:hypothetical protein